MDASKRKADDSLNGTIPEEPATKKVNTNESVDSCLRNEAAICRGYKAEATLSLTTTIESLETDQDGEEVLIGNHLKWFVRAKRTPNNKNEDSLALCVRSTDQHKYPFTLSIEYALEALHPTNRIVTERTRTYDEENFCHGVHFVKWEKLLNERDKFETDGQITMTAKINISLTKFFFNFDSVRLYSDVKISIDSKLFPVNKAFLASHSEYFNTMFFGPFKESNQGIVRLEDVDAAAFVNIMNLLYVQCFELKSVSAAPVLELADRFGMFIAFDHCLDVLVSNNSDLSLAKRLTISSKFSIDKLQEHCLNLCRSAMTIKEVTKSADYEEMPDALKAKLLKRLVDVLPPSNCGRIVTGRTRIYDEKFFFHGVHIVKWEKLLDERDKFETDGKITMTAKVKISLDKFFFNFDSSRLYSDIKISIDSKLFPVNKAFLAAHSEYFNTMFFGVFKESNQGIVTLEDVDGAAFVNLMNLLYVQGFKVKSDSVASVLELAVRFGMSMALDHCVDLLMDYNHYHPSIAKRLIISAKFSLDKLQEHCLDMCYEASTIKEVTESSVYEKIPDALKAKLLKRLIEVLPYKVWM